MHFTYRLLWEICCRATVAILCTVCIGSTSENVQNDVTHVCKSSCFHNLSNFRTDRLDYLAGRRQVTLRPIVQRSPLRPSSSHALGTQGTRTSYIRSACGGAGVSFVVHVFTDALQVVGGNECSSATVLIRKPGRGRWGKKEKSGLLQVAIRFASQFPSQPHIYIYNASLAVGEP